ncbi:zinc ribbon domain-containing protein [Limosilactobacillus equigenerosi]|uniref:Zinc-ribbon domain-containing protein n=1 Tax=Limosilactobacillus equigenerosi DSM 18793 = JCM 14505 TaxID=1423742 RepID=A0A0R1UP26_9LACO|nr:zinc ribbon domain-containing protein [Limosilactobacillus equigenerosi]KRL94892.1 hypothetical protein FC21_GL000935 [Limosilactobacillus equigenerosi DSM 18793 = JCM 14505]
MKFCPNCGTQTEPGATNCFNCGFALPQPKTASPTNQSSGPTPTKFDDYPVGVQEDTTPATTNDDSHALTWLITAIIIVTVVIALLIFIF